MPPSLPESSTPVMPDITIIQEGVFKLLENLDPNKSSGPDEIPAKILKLAAKELAPALTKIFQSSLDTGKLPDSWLQANITPLFKKGDRHLASNYRPVSLTSICCKTLEHIIHSNIMKHFSKHNILTDRQHGFRRGHSCETQLILTAHDLAKSLDSKSQVDMAIMDFSKAFDVVPHNRLLSKLKHHGIQNKTLVWISAFLQNRTQRVLVSGDKSSWCDVLSGVPQGTVLGPLLFLTYINDLPENIQSTVRLFADDCVIYREIRHDLDAQILQDDLNTLEKWEQKWLMKFNLDKCFIMKLTHARSTKSHEYTLGGKPLLETKSHSYLGVCINNKLNWNQHIQEITAKSNRTLGFVKRNLYACSKSTKQIAYKSLVRPKLEYCAAVWDPYTIKNTRKLETVQKRAARFILNDYESQTPGCATKMVSDLKLEPLAVRRKTRRLSILNQTRLGHLSLPLDDFLQPIQRQSRHTHRLSYTQISTSKDCYKYSYLPRTILDWNFLPESIVTNQKSTESFKNQVTKHLNQVNQKHD